MKLTTNIIKGNYDGKQCFVHARACAVNRDRLIMTAQLLNVRGNDAFSGIFTLHSFDGGKSWTKPEKDAAFAPQNAGNGLIYVPSDAAHLFVRSAGTDLCACHQVYYKPGGLQPVFGQKRLCTYSSYDFENKCYRALKTVNIPPMFRYGAAAGSAQFVEKAPGEVLLPLYTRDDEWKYMLSVVMLCDFDGETLTFKQMGKPMTCSFGRGLYEPSLCCFEGRYFITLRNDDFGFCASGDGLNFSTPKKWCWDNGETVPTYNTQQHWLICGGGLYLVYTRRAGNNDHVFRHRAPLFMARVDTERLCLIRETEQTVVPERGARLGNFGVTQADDNFAFITAAEWMQPEGCEKYGSDNSIFVVSVDGT